MKFIHKITHLLSIEWLKAKYSTLFWVILGGFTVLFSIGILYSKKVVPFASPPLPSLSTFLEFPTIWDYQGHIGNWLVCVLLGFLMINSITSEIGYKTMRQNIIDGLTKDDFLLGKAAFAVCLATFATLIYTFSTIVIGFAHTNDVDFTLIFDTNGLVARFWLMSIGYLTIAGFIAFGVKRSGLSYILYFAYIFLIEFGIRMLQLYYFKSRAMLFYPINVIEDLVPNPLLKMPNVFLEKEWGFSAILEPWEAIITALIYISIVIWLTRYLMLKRDI